MKSMAKQSTLLTTLIQFSGSSITFNTTKKKLNLMQAAAEYFLQGLALANKDSITQQEYQGKYINQGFKSVYNVEN